jgi:DNA-binding MarR family transcriptional regulator
MNQTLRTLEDKRWVTRSPHPGHDRVLQASLTPDGREALLACHEAADAIEERMLAGSARRTDSSLSRPCGPASMR